MYHTFFQIYAIKSREFSLVTPDLILFKHMYIFKILIKNFNFNKIRLFRYLPHYHPLLFTVISTSTHEILGGVTKNNKKITILVVRGSGIPFF